jgi:hypothetical protein
MKKIVWGSFAKALVIVVIALVMVAAFAPMTASAETPDQMRARVIGEMFAKHSDFACVAILPSFTGVRNPTIDALAQEKKWDANQLQCYYYAWIADRDWNATNKWDAKGHYFRAGRTITNFDREDLYWRDLNAIIESLGWQVPFPYISDVTDRPFHTWTRYPTVITAE